MLADLLSGVRLVGASVNLANPGGNANGLAVFAQSVNASQIGTKSLKLKKIMARNNAVGASTWLHFGTGVAGAIVDIMPAFLLLNNFDAEWQEIDIPNVEVFADLMAYVDAIAAGSVDVQVEVDEIG